MKNYLFSKLFLIALLLYCVTGTMYAYIVDINGGGARGSVPLVFYNQNIYNSNVDYLYPQSMLQEANVTPGEIKSVGFQVGANTYNPTYPERDGGVPQRLRIYIANVGADVTALTQNQTSDWARWTLVYQHDDFTFNKHRRELDGGTGYARNDWVTLKFNTGNEFEYDGGGLLIKICREIPYSEPCAGASWENVPVYANNVGVNSGLVFGSFERYTCVATDTNGDGTFDTDVPSIPPHPNYCGAIIDNGTGSFSPSGRRPCIQLEVVQPEETVNIAEGGTMGNTAVFSYLQWSNHFITLVTENEWYRTGLGKPGDITSLSLRLQSTWGNVGANRRTTRIYMAQLPKDIIGFTDINNLYGATASAYGADWQLVYEKENFSLEAVAADNGVTTPYKQGDWVEFRFNKSNFAYQEGSFMYMICNNNTNTDIGYLFYARNMTAAQAPQYISATSNGNIETACTDRISNYYPTGRVKLDSRFNVSPMPMNYVTYNKATVIHPTLEHAITGATNVQVLQTKIELTGTDRALKISKMNFVNKSLDNVLSNAKLWYTGASVVLRPDAEGAAPIAELTSIPTDGNFSFTIPAELQAELKGGTHIFWLTVDISPQAIVIANAIDASLTDFEFITPPNDLPLTIPSTDASVTTPDPEGAISISDFVKIYCPEGETNPVSAGNWWPSNPMSGNFNIARSKQVYTHDELNDGATGIIGEIALYAEVASGGTIPADSIFIYMRNLPRNSGGETTAPAFFLQEVNIGSAAQLGWATMKDRYIAEGYQLVAGPVTWPVIVENGVWVNMPLSNQFYYNGGDLDIIIHKDNMDNFAPGSSSFCGGGGTINYWKEAMYADKGYQYTSTGFLGTNGGTLSCARLLEESITAQMSPKLGEYIGDYDNLNNSYYRTPKPNLRLSIRYMEGSQYRASNAFQTDKQTVAIGAAADEVLGVMIETEGDDEAPYENLKQLVFDGKDANTVATRAMLYYSGRDSIFAVAKPIGQPVDITASNVNNIQFNFEQNEIVLNNGRNYFWLVYEIANNPANIGKTLDAKFVSGTLQREYSVLYPWRDSSITSTIQTIDPAGNKSIVGPLSKGTYYVGTSSTVTTDYATLSDFANQFSRYGIDRNTEVIIVSSIADNRTARFNYNPHNNADYSLTLRIDPAATTNYNISCSQSNGSVIDLLPGLSNLHIDGGNGNGAQLTFIKLGTSGDAITATDANNIYIRNSNIMGSTNGVNFNRVSNFELYNNVIVRASNYAVNVAGAGTGGRIEYNSIGSVAADVHNGLAIVDGSRDVVVNKNVFTNLFASANNRAILVRGTAATHDLGIYITNNMVNDVKSNGQHASALEIDNAGDVHIYHNTVIFSPQRGAQRSTQMLYLQPAAAINVDLKNNLFINNVANMENFYSQQYYIPALENATITGSGNIYSGSLMYRWSGADYGAFDSWQSYFNTDATSNHISTTGRFVSEVDFHTDGMICNDPAIMVDVLTDDYSGSDIDGEMRGAFMAGKTTAGADEVFLVTKPVPSVEDFPASIQVCETSYESIILKVDRSFERWNDNVARSYIPPVTNTWITENGDTLKTENGINVSRQPYFYIERPNYTHTMKLKCVSNIWAHVFTTEYCDITVVKAPTLRAIPDLTLCYDAGKVEIETINLLDGIAAAFQWQKRNGTVWSNLAGQTTSKLDIDFESNENSIAEVAGLYRLQVTPHSICSNNGNVYSNEINVNIGYHISDANLVSSLDGLVESIDGINTAKICVNNEIWLTANTTNGSITKYQWEKYDAAANDWRAIETIINPTATSDTLRIYSTNTEHSGLYRCRSYGCSDDNIVFSNTLQIEIEPASELIAQPAPVTVTCVGKVLTDELSVSITDPDNELSQHNQYQWFKDGKPFERLDDLGNQIDPSHPLYSKRRTDTTYLPFEQLTTKDGGAYILRTIYINCAKEQDTLFSDTAKLFVYNAVNLVSQSSEVYAVLGGYTTLEMNMSDDAAAYGDALGLKYTWYRKREIKEETGAVRIVIDTLFDSPKFSGTNTEHLRINNVSLLDVNQTDDRIVTDYYYCEVFEYCLQKTTTSGPMILKVAPDLNIIENPASITVCLGATATMTADAASTDDTKHIIYEWYKTGSSAPISSGWDNKTLTINDIDLADVADYYCVVSLEGLTGTNKQTSTASIAVNTTPKITDEIYPAGGVVAENSAFELKVTTDDNGTYTYQWYFNNVAISNATAATYSVTSATKANEGEYFVAVTNQCGETQSTKINIKVGVGIIDNNDPTFRIVSVLPNPITYDATINFILPEANTATLTLVDMSGGTVAKLYAGNSEAGPNTVSISNKLNNISSGTYFVILEAKGRKASLKVTISK